VLGLCGLSLLAARRYWRPQPEIPRVALLPLGLMLLVLVQFALGKIDYFSQTLLAALYLLWAALLVMLGQRLREELGLPVLVTALAAFQLLGAELSALIGMAQHYSWSNYLFDRVVVVKIGSALPGNIGQPNHFADYTALGLVSLGLLGMRWKMRYWQVVLLAAPLLFVLVLSGSRSSWLYLPCMVLLAFLWQRRDKSNLPLLHYSLALLLGFGLMNFAVQIPSWLPLAAAADNAAATTASVTAVDRLVSETGSDSVRLHLWREAWFIFLQHPLLGSGFGQFAWQHFRMATVLHDLGLTKQLHGNAHNLEMQVAAEMGLAGLSVLLGTLALWFRQARAAPRTIYHWWGGGLLAVLAIHSQLEYPLWYSYFLGMAAITLGMLDSTVYRPKLRGFGRWPMVAVLLSGAVLLSLTFQSYRKLESLNFQIPPEYVSYESYSQNKLLNRIRGELVALREQSQAVLLHPYINYLLGEIGWDHVADKGALNERVMHYRPISSVAYREAIILARAGLQTDACMQIERAIWFYPKDFPATREKLRELADEDKEPSRFPALLEFAIQKYEERQHMEVAK
jgi:O-antigen ligase